MPTSRSFRDLVDVPSLQRLTDDLYRATGIPSAVIGTDGEVFTGSGWQRVCTQFHRRHPVLELDCIASDTAIRRGIDEGEAFVIYECPRGLVDACAPVVIEGEHVANVFAGQLFMTPPDAVKEAFFRETARTYGLDEEGYLAAYREIPVLPEDRFRPILSFLVRFAKLVATIGLARRREQEATDRAEADERRYLRLLQATSTVPWELDVTTGRFTYVGPQAEKVLGFPVSHWRTRDDWVAALHPADRSAALAHSRAETAAGRDHESTYRLLASDGRVVWIRAAVTVIGGASGAEKLVGFLHDVTEQKTAEESRWENERRFESLLKTALDGFWVVDLEGRLVQVNDAYCRMSGYTERELIGMTIQDLEAGEHPDETAAHLRRLLLEGRDRFESRHRHKNGGVIDVEVSTQFQPWGEGRIVAFIRDITERKKLEGEKEQMERQLRQAQKLEAVGTLAGGIAHDFNNILTPILAHAELALMGLPDGHPVRDDVGHVLTAAERAAALVRQILDLARRDEDRPAVVALAPLVKEVAKFVRASLPSTIEIRTSIDPGCGPVVADVSRLHQVLLNLCTNARDAMCETGGVLTLSLERASGRRVKLVVRDTGPGIPPELAGRIFEPYFTTKVRGKGTGLGLATVHAIVTALGGEVVVHSEEGSGSTFEVVLPEGEQQHAPAAAKPELPRGNRQRVLVVDDEPAIADVVERMLHALGYGVITFTSAGEALAAFRADPTGFDAVLTDYTMPGLTGLALAAELHKVRPELPVLVGTGLAEGLSDQSLAEAGVGPLLKKPYSVQRLGQALGEALG